MVKKKTTSRLSEKAMLVRLSVSIWTGRTKDKNVSEEVKASKHSTVDSGAWWTYLLPRENLKKISSADNKVRTVWRKHTLPWQDEGCRILPSKMYMEYTTEIRKATEEFNEAVEEFLNSYPLILKSAQKRLGELYDTSKFPTTSEIRHKFGVVQNIYPLPDSTDFRVNISEDDADAIRQQINSDMKDVMGDAMKSVWDQMAQLIGRVEETLKKPDKIFRRSLIGNLAEFCDLLPKLNVMDDPNLEDIRKVTVAQLATLSPDDLRVDKKERKQAAKAAGDVLKKMADFM